MPIQPTGVIPKQKYSLSKYYSQVASISPPKISADDQFIVYAVVEQNEKDFLLKVMLGALILFVLLMVV